MYHDINMSQNLYEQHRASLTQSYVNSQADAKAMRAFVDSTVDGLGSLVKWAEANLLPGQKPRLEPLPVSSKNRK